MPKIVTRANRDYYGGALIIAFGIAAIFQGIKYKIGTLSETGPGFFPVSLGIILVLIGVAIIITAKLATRQQTAELHKHGLPPEWRGWLCIAGSIVAFELLGKYGGLLPATFGIVFISALGDRHNSIKSAMTLAIVMSAISVVVFWWALQMQFPLLQWGE